MKRFFSADGAPPPAVGGGCAASVGAGAVVARVSLFSSPDEPPQPVERAAATRAASARDRLMPRSVSSPSERPAHNAKTIVTLRPMEGACARCGEDRGEGRWCATCGLDSTPTVATLPTEEAMEAGNRERAWFAANPEREREREERAASAKRWADQAEWERLAG